MILRFVFLLLVALVILVVTIITVVTGQGMTWVSPMVFYLAISQVWHLASEHRSEMLDSIGGLLGAKEVRR